MQTKNLVFTATAGMNREEWLEWRQPLFHVRNFLLRKRYTSLNEFFETQEWKDFTFPIVGASDIGVVMGLSPYKSIIELFYELVGLKPAYREENNAMYWGKTLEAIIAENWQYWEGSPESIIENSSRERCVRRCRRLNAYIQNKAFPWLFCSLDRVINKQAGKEEGLLECKTISGFASKMWEHGIPPYHVAQLQDQLLITELSFGELAMLKDGRDFEVYPFDPHPEIFERIKRESFKFFQMVKKGIEFYLLWQASGNEDYLTELDKYSPEPDASLSYESFLNSRFEESGYTIQGGPVEIHLAKAYKYFDAGIKEMQDRKREASNKLKAAIKDAATLDLGEAGKVLWKADKRGTRALKVFCSPEAGFRPNPEILKAEALPEAIVPHGTAEAKVIEMPPKPEFEPINDPDPWAGELPPGWD